MSVHGARTQALHLYLTALCSSSTGTARDAHVHTVVSAATIPPRTTDGQRPHRTRQAERVSTRRLRAPAMAPLAGVHDPPQGERARVSSHEIALTSQPYRVPTCESERGNVVYTCEQMDEACQNRWTGTRRASLLVLLGWWRAAWLYHFLRRQGSGALVCEQWRPRTAQSEQRADLQGVELDASDRFVLCDGDILRY